MHFKQCGWRCSCSNLFEKNLRKKNKEAENGRPKIEGYGSGSKVEALPLCLLSCRQLSSFGARQKTEVREGILKSKMTSALNQDPHQAEELLTGSVSEGDGACESGRAACDWQRKSAAAAPVSRKETELRTDSIRCTFEAFVFFLFWNIAVQILFRFLVVFLYNISDLINCAGGTEAWLQYLETTALFPRHYQIRITSESVSHTPCKHMLYEVGSRV